MAVKLHELLAVDTATRSQAEATRNELTNTFEKKRALFSELIVTFHSNAEGAEPKVEAKMAIQSTISKELDWISEKMAAAMDVANQIDFANTEAKADVVLETGQTLLTGIPVTGLLQLEKRVVEIHALINAIPTLDPVKGFEPDPSRGEGIYRARDVEKPRTEKKFHYVVMVAPTDKHPAQVKELMIDDPVGHVVQQEWSSMLTIAQKGDMLDRIEILARAIRKARARGNEIEVDVTGRRIGKRLLDYVFRGRTA